LQSQVVAVALNKCELKFTGAQESEYLAGPNFVTVFIEEKILGMKIIRHIVELDAKTWLDLKTSRWFALVILNSTIRTTTMTRTVPLTLKRLFFSRSITAIGLWPKQNLFMYVFMYHL